MSDSGMTDTAGARKHRVVVPDKVVLFAAAIGGAALYLPLFVIKENRLVSGIPVAGLEVPGYGPVLSAIVVVIGLSGVVAGVRRRFALSAVAVVLYVVCWGAIVHTGTSMLAERGYPFGLVSPGGGFWLLLLSALILISVELKRAGSAIARVVPSAILIALPVALLAAGYLDDLGFVREYLNRVDRFARELGAHLRLAFGAVFAASVVGIPLGVGAWRKRVLRRPVFTVVNSLQTVPSLALFGLMIAPLALLSQRYPFLRELGIRGVGNTPAFLALSLYALLPIVRNAYTSLSVIDPGVILAGTGMGMTRRQLLRHVEIPIALPILLSGVRVSAVQTVGNTAVAALIGAGGLGNFVFQGLNQGASDLIVMGVIPIVVLAVLTDRLMLLIIGAVRREPQRLH